MKKRIRETSNIKTSSYIGLKKSYHGNKHIASGNALSGTGKEIASPQKLGLALSMKNISRSLKIYIGLIGIWVVLAVLNVFFFLVDSGLPTQDLPASKPIVALVTATIGLVLYGGLGVLGLSFSQKLGFPNIWESTISNKERIVIPALVGIGIGAFFILVDMMLSRFHALGAIPHPSFPASLVASGIAGIGEELLFRLFFISFWVWLLSYVFLKRRYQQSVFWVVTGWSALVITLAHLPSVMVLFGLQTISEIPVALLVELILINGVLTLFAAYYLKKSGFLAAVGIHFWADMVWHVIWGLISSIL